MSQDKHSWQTALVLGVEISVAVVAGKFIGEWIDNTYATKPWGMVLAILIFSTAVMVSILKKLKKILMMKTESGLEILFEDKWLLAVFKPAGIAVHHTPKDPDNNVQSQLEADYKQKLTLFHRLDKDTSGVLLFGKKPGINKAMSEAFEKRKIKKTYWALVEGAWPPYKKNITSYLKKIEGGRFESVKNGEPKEKAITDFSILESRENKTLLEVRPQTGRQHQIRVHCSWAGHPICGDTRYDSKTTGPLALVAAQLEFLHPISEKPLIIKINQSPKDLLL